MPTQKTRLQKAIGYLGDNLSYSIVGSWKNRSMALLGILFGYYLASILSSYYLQKTDLNFFLAILIVILTEVFVRLRTKLAKRGVRLFLVAIDNIRIGATYAFVLEAFKLGS